MRTFLRSSLVPGDMVGCSGISRVQSVKVDEMFGRKKRCFIEVWCCDSWAKGAGELTPCGKACFIRPFSTPTALLRTITSYSFAHLLVIINAD